MGPAHTEFAIWVALVRVSVPEDVTGLPDTVNSVGADNPTLVAYERAGMSAATSERKVGAVAAPVDGPANTKLADCVVRVPVRVPDAVTGLPDTLKMLGRANPTLVTVPPLLGGVAQVPSALKKLAVPPPEDGASPLSAEVKVSNIAVVWVPVKSNGAAVAPVLLPLMVFAGIVASLAFVMDALFTSAVI